MNEQLTAATRARKCHGCGCFHQTVEALAATEAGRQALLPAIEGARRVFVPKKHDCLGCRVCFPVLAADAFSEAFPAEAEVMHACPSETLPERAGWPPLPGDYRVLRWKAPVAVCALNSGHLVDRLASMASEHVAIVGTLHTENLGIERIVRNILANPHLRFLLLCGQDTRQRVGHLPGQALVSLCANGVDEAGRILGARGKRPVLKNVTREQIDAFRRQVEIVDCIGEERPLVVLQRVRECASRDPGAFDGWMEGPVVPVLEAREPQRMVADPLGFFVVYPDARRRRLVLEHYRNDGLLDCVMEGTTPAALYAMAIERGLVSRFDHAAYLGRELARAEHALRTGEPYVQDRAPGEPEPHSSISVDCGCGTACRPEPSP
ncbi:MAG: DUF4346 domain-containing protein [Myxococcales bacterium]|nr:DUF4346 domain-containing protein [Myxococcales bacterium]